jgi:hypothetical protein
MNKQEVNAPNERWQSQRKTAWAKLARSDALEKEVEALAEQMFTERKSLSHREYPDQSSVQKAIVNSRLD